MATGKGSGKKGAAKKTKPSSAKKKSPAAAKPKAKAAAPAAKSQTEAAPSPKAEAPPPPKAEAPPPPKAEAPASAAKPQVKATPPQTEAAPPPKAEAAAPPPKAEAAAPPPKPAAAPKAETKPTPPPKAEAAAPPPKAKPAPPPPPPAPATPAFKSVFEQPVKKAHCNGLELAYQEYGSPSDPAVVFVMGLGAQLTIWPDEMLQPLVEAGYRVVRFDNRDVGESPRIAQKPSGIPPVLRILAARLGIRLPAPYQLENMAADAIGLMDALDMDRAHLVGASLGGMIVQVAALNYPHRLASMTSIMSTGAMPPDGDQDILAALTAPPPETREEAVEAGVAMWQMLGSSVYKPDMEQLRKLIGFGFDRGGGNTDGVARQVQAIMSGPSRYKALGNLKMPTLVIHGTEDRLVRPHHGERTAQSIPGARWELIEGMGHAFEPEVTEKIVPMLLKHFRAA